jgi:hypothetical protein
LLFLLSYRRIYSLNGFFFLLSLIDWSVPYHPETKTLMDIETALNFFHEGREATKLRIGNMARALVAAWNKKYEGTSTVRDKGKFFIVSFI